MPKPNVTFQILRDIAESASGLRDHDLYFVVTGEPARYTFTRKKVEEGPDNVVIFCKAVHDPPSRVRKASIGDGTRTIDLMKVKVLPDPRFPQSEAKEETLRADAVFWSVSAVEKFLVPYYASVYGDKGPKMAKAVLDVLLPPTETAEGGEAMVEDETPFAVAHLPSSEFVGEPEADPVFVHRLAALYPSGHVRRVRLAPQGR